jgi:hypothetical protein
MYKIQVYVDHGYYEYEVDTAERAVNHGQKIMQRGVYRHATKEGIEFHTPHFVRAIGPGLDSKYSDTFMRT